MAKRSRADEDDFVSKINRKFVDDPFQGSKKMTPKWQMEVRANVSIQCGSIGVNYLNNATKDASGQLVFSEDYLEKRIPRAYGKGDG